LIERDNVEAGRKVGGVGVNDILEVFGKPFIQWIKVHSAVNHSQ